VLNALDHSLNRGARASDAETVLEEGAARWW
jgi:hypothetical protein